MGSTKASLIDLPEVLVIDCDGVLTDGKLTIDHLGEKLFKQFHTRDVRAIRELVANGVEVYIVSADDWGGTKAFAEKVGAEFICCRDKATIVPQLKERRWWAVGDDTWDVPLLKAADLAFCTIDADTAVKLINGIIPIAVKGGHGVIASLVNYIFKP